MLEIYAVMIVLCIVIAVMYLLSEKKWRTTIPGMEPADSLKGNFPDIMRVGNLHEFLMNLHKTYGPIASFWWGPKLAVSIASPQLFKEHSKPFDRPVEMFELIRPILGERSIQYANGSDGRRRHAAYSKCFTTDAIYNYYERFAQLSREFVAKWSELPADEHIPLRQCTLDYTIKAMLQCSFGNFFTDVTKIQQIRQAFEFMWTTIQERWKSNDQDTSGVKQRELEEHSRILVGTMLECMAYRRENPPTAAQHLVIDAILELDMAEEATMSDLVTVFVGGFLTSGLTLVWALYFLANHSDVQEKVCEELTRVLGDGVLDMDNMKDLTYLQQVVDETMRCSVMVTYAARVQDCDINLGGHTIPAGTPIIHALGVVLQDSTLYQDPARFDPERFNPGNVKARPNFSFEPFGFAGKRKCLGYRFALVEVKVVLSTILRKFKVSLVDGQVITPMYGLVTMPNDEVWVKINKRRN